MRFTAYLISMAIGIALMTMVNAHAENDHEHEGHRHHGAHVHGMATLDLVMDGQELMMHLQSPLINFLGFEHEPATEQQKASYQDMLKLLERMDSLITIEGSTCEAELIEVADPFASEGEAGHADVEVSYFLRCEQPNEITGLKINLFDIYSNLETLQVQMVIPSGQQQLELNPQRTTLRIN